MKPQRIKEETITSKQTEAIISNNMTNVMVVHIHNAKASHVASVNWDDLELVF